MQISSLSEYVKVLDESDEIIRIQEFVNPDLEISEIADRFMKQPNGGKALLFENNGTKFPVLINHYGSDIRILKALGLKTYSDPSEKIEKLFDKIIKTGPGFMSKLSAMSELKSASAWIPKKTTAKGKCQEIVIREPDLAILPVLKCWPFDGGKFVTLPLVITEDPETGIRNVGMYRMQIFSKNTSGMHWHLHKGGAAHFNKYKMAGKKMPVSVVLGGDPALTYCATAPLPENIDEFMLAGFLRDKSVKLVKCITNDIYVPDSSDFVIEGYIDPAEEFVTEGPFGDHTGFYSLEDKYPVFHVTCITHRKDAIYPATIVGVPPMEDFYLGKATERIFLKPIQLAIAPEIIDIRLPDYGVAHNLVLIKTKTHYPGQNIKIMNALLGAGQMMFSKVIICFNESIDIQNDTEVFNAITQINNLKEHIVISKGPSDVLDHSAYKYTFSGKLLIDAGDVYPKSVEFSKQNSLTTSDNNSAMVNNIMIIQADSVKDISYREYAISIVEKNKTQDLKAIVIIDNLSLTALTKILLWYILNNIDPSHDCVFKNDIFIIDASIKTTAKDGFTRDWPNVVCMDLVTINNIDERWNKILKTDLIPSPSNDLIQLQQGNSAIYNHSDR